VVQVLVGDLFADHRQQLAEPGGAELAGMLVAQATQLFEVAGKQFKNPNGAAQDGLRVAGHQSPEKHLPLNFDPVDRDIVHLLHHSTISRTIGQHLLAVDDNVRIDDGERYDFFGRVEQEFVFSCHSLVEPWELQIVVDQVAQLPWQPGFWVEVAFRV
jgi:hypothetical protein